MGRNYSITIQQIRNMKHCIGFKGSEVTGTKYRKMKSYRNNFTTSGDKGDLDELVNQGLMIKRDSKTGVKGHKTYHVSDEGYKFLSELTEIEITEVE